MEIFTGFSVVSAFVVLYWLVKWPAETAESVLFQNNDGVLGHAVSVLTWLIILGVVNGVFLILNA